MTAPAVGLGVLPEVDGSNQVRLEQRLAALDAKARELKARGIEAVVRECRDGVFRIVPQRGVGS